MSSKIECELECEDYSDHGSLSSIDLEKGPQRPTTAWDPVSVPGPPSKDNTDENVQDLVYDDDVFAPVAPMKVSKNVKSVLHQKAQQVRTQRKENVDIITTSPIRNTPTVSDVSS